jgi:DNA modification methylase
MSNPGNILDMPVSTRSITHRDKGKKSLVACIDELDRQLFQKFKDKFVVDPSLSRSVVSFQANKTRPIYRWYKFKEAFSASLVEYLFHKYGITTGRILDPFAGSGTTLFAASAMGIDADGIELLPIGHEIIMARQILETMFTPQDFERLRQWATLKVWEEAERRVSLPELRITQGAYPEKTKESIEKYISACQHENSRVRSVLRFVLLCVLESISFTRKDGQYLRWDYRSGRKTGKKIFDKGEILSFDQAVREKINEILEDTSSLHPTSLFPPEKLRGQIRLYDGSCLEILPTLPGSTYDAIMTSPPYCNRYDYTRTYALELALLGTDEAGLARLRQEMISCTVENRAKDLLRINPEWTIPLSVADHQEPLQAILKYLEDQKAQGKLNNNGIPRMVRGYFYEMACVIAECARVLKPNARLFMVNDNVRYAGVSISVDMILSEMAEKLGFYVENILVLPNGKGNSSQQMAEHGREALRKCVYVWKKL